MAAPWSWISLDGKSVAAIPSHNRVDIVDTQDFSLLGRIQGNIMSSEPFHENAITRAIWNTRRVCLLSLSSTALLLHTPDRENKLPCSSFTLQWHLPLDPDSVSDVAFSRCGQTLLLGGPTGLSVWNSTSPVDFELWWQDTSHPCDFVVFSPCRTVFASHETLSSDVYVWRHAGRAVSLPRAQVLSHDEEVEYISWKPTHYQPQTSDDHDGTRPSQWDEPACVLLSLTRSKTIRIWTEQPSSDTSKAEDGSSDVVMTCIVFLQPSPEMDIVLAQWIVPRAQNISQEYFGPAASAAALPRERLQDWLSVVDSKGVLHVWTVDALHLPTQSQLLRTGFVFKVDGEDERLGDTSTSLVTSYQIAGYASQGFLSSVSILLERTDQVLLSYQVAWTPSHPPVLKEKSWYRGHTAPIAALATHPSLPLVVSVSHPRHGTSELIIFWLSLSMFTSESHFVPSCILQGPAIAAVHWIPTRHFQARPLLLISYESGRWEIFSPYESQLSTLLESPRIRHQTNNHAVARTRNDTMVYPWTYHEHELGESGFEYEVSLLPHPDFGLGLTFTLLNDKIVVAGFTTGKSDKNVTSEEDEGSDSSTAIELPAAASRQICLHDECVSVNNVSMKGKLPVDLKAAVAAAPPQTPITMRFRTPGSRPGLDQTAAMTKMQHWSMSSQDGESDDSNRSERGDIDEDEQDLSLDDYDGQDAGDAPIKSHGRGNTTSNRRNRPRGSTQVVVSGGSISKFGGWSSLGHVVLPCTYADLAVAPLYSDAGNFVSDAVVLFGVAADTRDLHCWMGVESRKGEFDFLQLTITASPASLVGITTVGAERDYRQRAFESSSSDAKTSSTPVWNALLFVGDEVGRLHHWRCRVSQSARTIDMSLVHSSTPPPAAPTATSTALLRPSAFFRRGYAMPPSVALASGVGDAGSAHPTGVFHMELDDPNRLAVVYTNQPESLYIWEGESGLGMLRLEAVIASEGRGPIIGFCWCSGHVEFHVDPLAVHFATSLVIYSYDLHLQTWVAQSEQTAFYPLFDCTRDASALILAAGSSFPGATASYHEVPTVLGKWDVHRHAVTTDPPDSANDQKHCPVWHPYTVLTTLCGMPARVGLTHTALADYRPAYDVQLAFGEAEQMLKLLAHVLEDDASTDLSAENGVLVYLHEKKTFGRRASVGRFAAKATASSGLSRAEDLFAPSRPSATPGMKKTPSIVVDPTHQESLTTREMDTLVTALDAVLRKHTQKVAVRYEEQEHRNAYVLFDSFELEHVLELKGLILFVQKMQSCLLNGYDLPAQRYFVAYLLTTCLQEVMQKTDDYTAVSNEPLAHYEDSSSGFVPTVDSYLHEIPSSSVIWALHSQSQNLLVDQCIHPQALWDDLRPLWPGLWVRDPAKLRSIIEKVAKCTFTRTKDAMSVSLLYIALKKQNILGALAKVSKVESNRTLAEFLAHDFTDERWSVAAVRNAYSLLRKKQYELAAAFFLLPTPPRLQESLRIIIGRLHDPSLAMVVGRLMECDQMPATHGHLDDSSDIFHLGDQTTEILRNDLVPTFRAQHNRWLESAALWWLQEYDQAVAVLQPSTQLVDVVDQSLLDTMQSRASETPASLSLVLRTKMAMDFLINLTSLPLFFQFSYCEVQLPLLKFAYAKLQQLHPTLKEEDMLTTKTDVDHAYSFTAYVCKHTGLSDTALLQMLQARHLLQVHVKKNFLYMLDTHHSSSSVLSTPADQAAKRTRLNSQQNSQSSSPRNHFFGSPRVARKNLARRTSFTSFSLDFTANSGNPDAEWEHLLLPEQHGGTGDSDKSAATSLWPKAELADMECRRWSSSAFVGKMIGMRVAREMISHFRLHVDQSDDHNHRGFLKELLDPLATQFQVDRQYILEATLAVLQPHAPLHLVECCFVLSELDRAHVMQEWIQCVSLSMLHATSHFPTVEWTDDVLREWKHLTAQLRHLQLLCDDQVLAFASPIRLTMQWAMQLGSVVLAWCTNHPDRLHDVILTDIPPVLDTFVVEPVDAAVHPCHALNFGYTFLAQSVHLTSHLLRVRQLYSTILMTQIVRTVYCNDQQMLLTSPDDFNDVTDNGCNGLYMPKTLWRAWTRHPLAGLKRWYLAMEAHVQLELHRIVLAEEPCECGHYGIDLAVRPWQPLAPEDAAVPTGPDSFADEELLLWMQHPVSGVPNTLRRYKVDPRVYVTCFTLKDAFVWLHDRGLCQDLDDTHELLGRWCQTHKVRWLVRRRSAMASHGPHSNSAMPPSAAPNHGHNGKISLELIPDEAFCFVSPWEVDAEHNVHVYMHGEVTAHNGNGGPHHENHAAEPHGPFDVPPQRTAAAPTCETAHLELGWDTLLPLTSHLCDDAAKVVFPNGDLKELWQTVCGEGWLVTAVQHFDADGLYMRQSQSTSTKPRSRYLADLFKQVQRNRLFRYLGLPHRLVAVISVELIEGKDLLACDILTHTADPYVFMTLSTASATRPPPPTPTGWNVKSYRSRHLVATLNPKWGTEHDRFPFRMALPVHESHDGLPKTCREALLQNAYDGPPTMLQCAVYNKCKLRHHPFMGSANVNLTRLTAAQPMDVWVDLDDVSTGSLHFKITLKYQLMSSTSYDVDFGVGREMECQS